MRPMRNLTLNFFTRYQLMVAGSSLEVYTIQIERKRREEINEFYHYNSFRIYMDLPVDESKCYTKD